MRVCQTYFLSGIQYILCYFSLVNCVFSHRFWMLVI